MATNGTLDCMTMLPRGNYLGRQLYRSTVQALAVICFLIAAANEVAACTDSRASAGFPISAPLTSQIKPHPPRRFGPDTVYLPAGYSGLNAFQLYLLLNRMFPPKGEYETTLNYERRLNEAKPFGLFYGYSSNHELPFVRRINSSSSWLSPKYDADKQELIILLPGFANSTALRSESRLEIEGKVLRSRQFIGSNPYGYKAIVDSMTSCSVVLSLKSIKWPLQVDDELIGYGGFLARVPMPAQLAMQVKDDLSVLFLVRIRPPFHSFRFNSRQPTIDRPNQWSNYDYSIHVDYAGMAVFQTSTGRVLLNAMSQAQ